MEHTSFSKEIYLAFKQANRKGPLHMLNLIRLRDRAIYEDGRSATGSDAYENYSRLSEPVLHKLGGAIIWRGGFEMVMIGPSDEIWDISFIAEYPSIESFLDMLRDPYYREAMTHRQAGVANSRLVRFTAMESGTNFSGSTAASGKPKG